MTAHDDGSLTTVLQRAMREFELPREVEVLPRETLPREIFGAPCRDALSQIARLLRSLTYGEMIELAAGMWTAKGPAEITADSLPKILHAWAERRQ